MMHNEIMVLLILFPCQKLDAEQCAPDLWVAKSSG
jgi:hypothetical protein